jgi:elongation factor P hydroxylase
MPQIPLTFGQMDLESDQSSRKDNVLAHLCNGYRVGQSIHMWPEAVEYCDLGTGADVFNWYSVLHSAHYAVSDGRLFRVSGGVATEITGATLTVGAVPSFTEDGSYVYVAAASNIHRIDGDTATALEGQAPVNVHSIAYLSGFLLAQGDDSGGSSQPGDFWYSDIIGEDGLPSYTEWSVENNASKPDALQAIVATPDGYLYAIGSESVDVSYISGSADAPFAANKAASQPFGTPARHSIAWDSESIYLLTVIGGNRQIMRLVGGRTPEIIGFPVGVPVNEIENVTDARSFLMGFRGQTFYVITFPTANVSIDDSYQESLTLAFSTRSQEWYIVGDWNAQKGQFGVYRGNSFAYDRSTRYIGGNDGKIYTLALEETRIEEPVFAHKWRNNSNLEWSSGRVLSLGLIGQRRQPLKSRMCGRYYKRQDELVFANGDTRMTIRTGWRSWGSNAEKISRMYVYDVKRGDTGVVFNGIEEDVSK